MFVPDSLLKRVLDITCSSTLCHVLRPLSVSCAAGNPRLECHEVCFVSYCMHAVDLERNVWSLCCFTPLLQLGVLCAYLVFFYCIALCCGTVCSLELLTRLSFVRFSCSERGMRRIWYIRGSLRRPVDSSRGSDFNSGCKEVAVSEEMSGIVLSRAGNCSV
jgi:hypothetical protein